MNASKGGANVTAPGQNGINLTTYNNMLNCFILGELADANNERVVFQAATTLSYTEADACDDTSVQNTPQETKLLVRYGNYFVLQLKLQ